MTTGKDFSMTAFEEAVAHDPEVLGFFYDGSQGRGTMDRFSDLDIKVWVTDAVLAEGPRKLLELLALLGEVHYRCPLHSSDSATALVGPDWQRVDLDLLNEERMKPWPGNFGARPLKDTDGRQARLIAEAPEKPGLPTVEEAAEFFAEFPDSQVYLALHNARGAVWSAMGEVSHQSAQLYTFLARLRGVASTGIVTSNICFHLRSLPCWRRRWWPDRSRRKCGGRQGRSGGDPIRVARSREGIGRRTAPSSG